jgi:hypothetical protein
MSTILVISKYEENVDWLKNIKYPYIIYDKSEIPVKNSIPRINIGRESETLLYYIISHYNNLPDITIFLQGDPRSNPVKYTYEEVVEEINKNHDPFLKTILTWEGNIDIQDYWLKSCKILHELLFDGDTSIKYSSGVQYIIPKDCILNRPIDLYILLYALVIKYGNKGLIAEKNSLNDGIDAWTLELIWGSIFNKNKKLKKNYNGKLNELLQNNP